MTTNPPPFCEPAATPGGRRAALSSPRAMLVIWGVLFFAKCLIALWLAREPYSDEMVYLSIARNVADGTGYVGMHGNVTASVMPGWPLLLAGSLAVSGGSLVPVYILQVVLSLAAALALGGLVELFTGRKSLARAASLVVFVFPPCIHYTAALLTEIPFTAWFSLSLLFWERTRRAPDRLSNWALLGLFHALGFMTRPVVFLITPVVVCWPLAEARFSRRAWMGAATSALVIAALWLPWVVRNERAFGKPVMLSTLSGYTLMGGSLADIGGWKTESENAMRAAGIEHFEDDEVGANAIISAAAKDNIRRDIPGWIGRAALRSWRFWLAEYPSYFNLDHRIRQYWASRALVPLALKLSLLALNGLVVVGAFWALWALRRDRTLWPYWLILAYVSIMHALLMPVARYSVPFTGLVICLVIVAISKRRHE